MNRVAEGLFLQFNNEEADMLWTHLEERGYTQDKDGLKSFLLDVIENRDKRPQVIIDEALIQKGTGLLGSWLKKKAGF